MRKISLLSFAAVVFALLTAAAPDPAHAYAERTLSQMSPSEKIGQLIIARAPAGTEISAEFEGLLTDYKPGGFCLFQQNVASAAQVRKLTEDLQERSAIPLFIAIDEEGGRVSRLNKLYEEEIPAAYKLAQSGADAVFEAYKTIGERLFSLGVNVDFAPVADIWSNDANRVIGDRAFAKDAETVSEMVEAALRGLDETPGVLSVIKHFPGHGDTAEDSHRQAAVYRYSRERFDSTEAVPFLRGISAGADGVMVGHIVAPEISGGLPASLSPYWMTEVLREEMGFEGLIFTDAMDMGAVTGIKTPAQAAVDAFLAGADVIVIPEDAGQAFKGLLDAYNEGIITDARLNSSVGKILRYKFSF